MPGESSDIPEPEPPGQIVPPPVVQYATRGRTDRPPVWVRVLLFIAGIVAAPALTLFGLSASGLRAGFAPLMLLLLVVPVTLIIVRPVRMMGVGMLLGYGLIFLAIYSVCGRFK